MIHGDFVDDPSSGPTTLFLREIYERMITNVIDPEQKLKTSGAASPAFMHRWDGHRWALGPHTSYPTGGLRPFSDQGHGVMNQNIPLNVIHSANLMPKNQTKRRELPQNDPQYNHSAASRVPYFAHRAATLFLFLLKTRLQETRPYQGPTIPTLKTKQLRRRHSVLAMARTAQNRTSLHRYRGPLPKPSHGPLSTG